LLNPVPVDAAGIDRLNARRSVGLLGQGLVLALSILKIGGND
jgi:hypothetical protein